MSYSLSLQEVIELSGRPVHLITADTKYLLYYLLNESLQDLEDKYILVHYQTSHTAHTISGHWVSMIIKPKIKQIWYFDSYGYFPDDQLKSIPLFYRRASHQATRDIGIFLYMAIKHFHFKVRYNEFKLQQFGNKVATCGYYSALFLRKSWTPERFAKSLLDYSRKNNISPDKTVIKLALK